MSGSLDALTNKPDQQGAKPLQEQGAPSKPARSVPQANISMMSGATAGIADRLAADRAAIDAKEPSFPALKPPPPPAPPSDPFQAFGQPAMYIALLGSLFTRRPFVNAIQAMGGVMQATQQLDAKAAQQHLESWKLENENAMKMAQFQQKAYEDAIKKFDVDAKAGKAMLETNILAFKDQVLEQAMAHGGVNEVKSLLFARAKQTQAVAKASGGTAKMLTSQVDMVSNLQSDDPAKQAAGLEAYMKQYVADQGGKGSTAAGRQQTLTASVQLQAAINDLKSGDPEREQRGHQMASNVIGMGLGALKPTVSGSTADQMNKVSADIQAQHPDWNQGQVTLEAKKRLHEATDQAGVSDETADMIAKLWLSGNKEAASGFSRSKSDREKIGNAITKQAQAAGMDTAAINDQLLSFRAQQSEALREGGAIGTRVGAITVAGNEAKRVFPLVTEAYSKLPRADFKPYNELRALVDKQTNTPEQKAAAAADFSAITTYARALNPSGIPRESDIQEAARILSTNGDSPESHQAVIDQWMQEIKAIEGATGEARDDLITQFRSKSGLPAAGGGASGGKTQSSPPVAGARQAPDGKWYVPDPDRPGKYLRVD